MTLETFGTGWRKEFEHRLESLKKVFPEARIERIERYAAMLRVKIVAPDPDIQYICDSVTYRIERESAKKCEDCGKHGIRRTGDLRLPIPKCLCFTCYALAVNAAVTQNT